MSDRTARTEFTIPFPPADEDDQRMVLGSLVSYPAEAMERFGGVVNPYLLPSPVSQLILTAISDLFADAAPVSVLTVTQRLRERGELDAVGGAYEVTRLATDYDCTPTVAEYHLSRLRDHAALRMGLETSAWLCEVSQNGTTEPAVIVAGMLEHIERIRAVHDAGDAPALALGSLASPVTGDGSELLRNRFLSRRGGALLVGPTGIGKSSFSLQAAVTWALGKPCFGIEPARPLRSVIIQAENDTGDMAEMRDGVFAGLELTPVEQVTAGDMIHCYQENERSGAEFFARTVEPLLRLHRPDLLWIDPALAYIGGESNSQKDVGTFLRTWLNPLLHRYECAGIIAHHSNKPPSGKEKTEWSGSDLAYLGSGSSEWANWARAVIAIRGLGTNGVFELCLGKRGGRVGWRNEAGEPVYSTLIGHAKEPGRIYWRNADESERPGAGGETGKRFTVGDVVKYIPCDGVRAAALQRRVCEETGMSRAGFYKLLREGEAAGRLHKEEISQLWVVQSV